MFRDRKQAGIALANLLEPLASENLSILAIPNGGTPVAFQIYKEFHKKNPNVEFNLLIVRKIPIPDNTEAGFGAVTSDGTIILNKPLVAQIGLTNDQIQKLAIKVIDEIHARLQKYGIHTQKFELINKVVILVDDGLASGYTMIAAIQSVKKFNPKKIIVAVPTAPRSSVERITPLVDNLICPNIRDTLFFAVADAYQNWYDLDVNEVREILKEVRSMSHAEKQRMK